MTKVPLPPSPTVSVIYEPEHVMNYRGGSVLGKKTILKSDHFPGCQNKRLTPQIDGAPNYRQVWPRFPLLDFFKILLALALVAIFLCVFIEFAAIAMRWSLLLCENSTCMRTLL